MAEHPWETLLNLVQGKSMREDLTGFIIDSPWIPGWASISTLDYYTSDEMWFEANRKALETFPDVLFLPGFWSEYGMVTEPSAFGSRVSWHEDSLPWAHKVLRSAEDISLLEIPDPAKDGLLPFVTARLQHSHDRIRTLGHEIRFAVARGPMNIASYLRGTTELMTDIMMYPDETHALLEKITQFTVTWLQHQKTLFPSIEGIFILDDLIGFVGDEEFRTFALPYLQRIFHAFEAPVRFLHNDAQGLITARYLREMDVNLFNFSFEHTLDEIRGLAGPEVVLLGNLPPRDVLAAGTPEQVAAETEKMITSAKDRKRILWSCGGGMPPAVSTENIRAFLDTVKRLNSK